MVACMALLSGCTESTIVKPTSETVVGDPNFETQENVEIDWTQVSTDAEDMFKDTSTYEYGRDFHFYMEPNKKQIMLIWVVADDLPDDQIGTYAEDLIKGFNDIVHTQDFSIEMSGEDSYGGLWKQYALSYSIVPESDQDNEDAWFSPATALPLGDAVGHSTVKASLKAKYGMSWGYPSTSTIIYEVAYGVSIAE